MVSMLSTDIEQVANPIELIEEIAAAHDWQFERQNDDEVAVQVNGTWCEYRMWFIWRTDLGALYFSCGFDMRVKPERHGAVYPLLAKLNERLWLGHFELWSEEGWPTFRHTLLASDKFGVTGHAIRDLVDTAVAECERFYPAFQFVIWGGKSTDEAIESSLLETVGEA